MSCKYLFQAKAAFATATIALATFAPSASAVVLYATSYEAPDFSVGPLSGQNGWLNTFGIDNRVVDSGPARTGSQSLQLRQLEGQQPFGGTERLGPYSTTLPQVVVEQSIYLAGADGWNPPEDYTWGVPVSLYGANGFIAQTPVYEGLNVVFGDAEVPIATDTWLDLKVVLDFPSQTATAFLNGALIGTTSFENPATELTLIETYGILGFTSPGPSPSFYFDDLSVTAVPEPGAVALFCLGLPLLAATTIRRRGKEQASTMN